MLKTDTTAAGRPEGSMMAETGPCRVTLGLFDAPVVCSNVGHRYVVRTPDIDQPGLRMKGTTFENYWCDEHRPDTAAPAAGEGRDE